MTLTLPDPLPKTCTAHLLLSLQVQAVGESPAWGTQPKLGFMPSAWTASRSFPIPRKYLLLWFLFVPSFRIHTPDLSPVLEKYIKQQEAWAETERGKHSHQTVPEAWGLAAFSTFPKPDSWKQGLVCCYCKFIFEWKLFTAMFGCKVGCTLQYPVEGGAQWFPGLCGV